MLLSCLKALQNRNARESVVVQGDAGAVVDEGLCVKKWKTVRNYYTEG